ncbi:hypothetical protein BASA83_007291 [Batrachochytrium salamandrivorans]|nr:hypothetical protein BASA83_007291 [Batrachochytrium salamandrivorans]
MRIERFVETNNLLSYEQAGFRKREEHCTHPHLLEHGQDHCYQTHSHTEGVRQGCPLSGLLFNLFINDILDGVAPITVPGLSRDTTPIRGLMYADDVAYLLT